MKTRIIKASVIAACSVLLLGGQAMTASAEKISEERSLGGMSMVIGNYVEETSTSDEEEQTMLLASRVSIPDNIAMAKVNDYVNIRENAGTNYNIIGILPKNAYCIVKSINGEWAHITSGAVTGYVSTQYLYLGTDGYQRAEEISKLTATVTAGSVNVRSEASTLSDNIIAEVSFGEELEVLDASSMSLFTKNDPKATVWVKVQIDDLEGYVSREFVDVSYKWISAQKVDPVDASTSSLRTRVVQESKKHLGLRYVWGGNSLVTGADCSGFVLAVYRKCNISTSRMARTSRELARGGKAVSRSNVKPGDMVFYGNSRGAVDHVAMYIGGGKVIHESGRVSGCKISNIDYRKVLAIRSYLD